MKNHFFISYFGNKRREVEKIYKNINLDGIKTIIEPFCGSSSISYYINKENPDKYNYILNDIDKNLMIVYNKIKNNTFNEFINKINNMCFNEKGDFIDKTTYLRYVKQNNSIEGWFIARKFYCIRHGLYPLRDKKKVNPINYTNDLRDFIDFIKKDNVILKSDCALNIIEKYKDDETTMIIIDPPYIDLDNCYYESGGMSGGNIYEYLYNNNNFKCKFVAILNKNWINSIIFKNFKLIEYEKKYETTKKKYIHCIYTN